jgi:hypothetical protein
MSKKSEEIMQQIQNATTIDEILFAVAEAGYEAGVGMEVVGVGFVSPDDIRQVFASAKSRLNIQEVMKPINEMNLDELAQYAVTLDGWDWMPGMLGYRGGSVWVRIVSSAQRAIRPDLTDPATLGCFDALCREKMGDDVWIEKNKHGYYWSFIKTYYPTRAHALIAALAKGES